MVAAATQIIQLPLQYCGSSGQRSYYCGVCFRRSGSGRMGGIGATQKEQRYDDDVQ
ncbi:unnamed protein product [Brassica rapa]|uniref:Uncharacterized protein n=1 Tax=Brassica campestris TaxID=3711 RepID=A0A3P6AFR7_BRACM|nr:unnamed protein product [Brassica rapa]VDC90567.1 unnamed protein product [Brassica rapa]